MPGLWRVTSLLTQVTGGLRHRTLLLPGVARMCTAPDLIPSLKKIENGEKVKHTFSKEEMEQRIARLRKHMEKNGIEGALFTSYHNINYYSDFFYCSFGRPFGLVVTMDKVTTLSAGIDGGQPWRRTATGGNVVYTDWQRDNFWHGVKQELVGVRGKIGVEFDHLTVDNSKKFKAFLPDLEVIDISLPCMNMRMIKSSEEIALIREGARICDVGVAAGVEACDVGIGEYEVALHSTQAMVREIAKTFPHAELLDTWTWFSSGINTDGGHNPVTSRKLQKGDILSLNCFPMIAGYYTALERTMFLDHVPSDRYMELWEINCRVHRRGIELIKPGARCCDIAKELNEIYKQYDLLQYRSFGYGHSFGVLGHYFGREAGLELREDIETVLQPNMVISMEPMIMIPEGTAGAGGYREHDICVVTEEGNEDITGFPFGPEHNIIKK